VRRLTNDGWRGYGALGAAGYRYQAIDLSRSRGEAVRRLSTGHCVFELAKRWLLGTLHVAFVAKDLQHYLDQYVCA